MNKDQINYNINAAKFDSDANTDENLVLLDNKTMYGLNVIHDLLNRGNLVAVRRALSELRIHGRLFNSQKYYGDVPVLFMAKEDQRDAYEALEITEDEGAV